MSKVVSTAEAIGRIRDRATLLVAGTGAVMETDALLEALEARFLAIGRPRDLTVFAPMLPGDRPDIGGLNAVAHEGMLSRLIGSSFNVRRHPRLIEMLQAERCEGYTIGMGAAVQLMTAIGGRKPGVFTTAGIGTFLDPRVDGGAMNQRSRNLPVRVENLDGNDYLFYPSFPVDVAFIRATTADENGYLTMEEEPNTLGMLEAALAAHASGGMVVAQVKRVARAGSLDPRLVRVPGPLVDAIVVHPRQSQVSPVMADPADGWNPFLAGALKSSLRGIPRYPQGPARVILSRAALELRPHDVINVGAGVATDLPRVALDEGFLDRVVFTNEHGIFGGLMANAYGGSFVPAYNADAIMDSSFQFNFYDGGGLDIAFLGIGELDAAGNVNVSRFARKITGPGGFADITDRTPRIVFCGTLTAGGLEVEISDGRLQIGREGKYRKLVPHVQQVTFSAAQGTAKGQSVLYVTERAVFRLAASGVELVELAPGVDLDRDVRAQVGFELSVSKELREMDKRIFLEAPMGLASQFSEEEA